jgi:hypothetical protein
LREHRDTEDSRLDDGKPLCCRVEEQGVVSTSLGSMLGSLDVALDSAALRTFISDQSESRLPTVRLLNRLAVAFNTGQVQISLMMTLTLYSNYNHKLNPNTNPHPNHISNPNPTLTPTNQTSPRAVHVFDLSSTTLHIGYEHRDKCAAPSWSPFLHCSACRRRHQLHEAACLLPCQP